MRDHRNAIAIESCWARVRGLSLHFRFAPRHREAPAIPVVLVYGLVVSSRYMVPTAERLAERHDVYAPDLPGYGRSEAPAATPDVESLAHALAEWLDVVGLERVAVVANSFGCQITSELAFHHPERVERVVLVGPTVDPRARSPLLQTLRALRDTAGEPPSYPLIMLRDYLDAGFVTALRTFQNALIHRIEERLPRISVPALVVRGSQDRIVPERWAEEVARLLPQGRSVVIPGARHAVNYDAPLELVRVTWPFLRDAVAGSSEAYRDAPERALERVRPGYAR